MLRSGADAFLSKEELDWILEKLHQYADKLPQKETESTSALFLMTTGAVQGKVVEALKGQKFELIASKLTKEQEKQLLSVFAEE